MTGEEFRKRRERLGLSQAQLAVALQRHHDTISRWERGTRAIEMPGVLRFVLDALEDERRRFGPDHEGFVASLPGFLARERAESADNAVSAQSGDRLG